MDDLRNPAGTDAVRPAKSPTHTPGLTSVAGPSPSAAPSPFGAELTDAQARAYALDTQKRGSRAKPSPTIARHRDRLKLLLAHKPNRKVLFADLIATDPAAYDEFGQNGYKRFNARLDREL